MWHNFCIFPLTGRVLNEDVEEDERRPISGKGMRGGADDWLFERLLLMSDAGLSLLFQLLLWESRRWSTMMMWLLMIMRPTSMISWQVCVLCVLLCVFFSVFFSVYLIYITHYIQDIKDMNVLQMYKIYCLVQERRRQTSSQRRTMMWMVSPLWRSHVTWLVSEIKSRTADGAETEAEFDP